MEQQLSDILDNLLGMLLLEGSYEIEEADDSFSVSIETRDAGRLIGARGESLDSLQLLVNQMLARKTGEESFKRVVVDVMNWREQKEEELKESARAWGKQVLESGKQLELEPQSSWQRRVIHMVIGEMEELESESIGEGRDRHIVIKLKNKNAHQDESAEEGPKVSNEKLDAETKED